MKVNDILEIMKSPKYFIGVTHARNESEKSDIQTMGEIVRSEITENQIAEHLFLLDAYDSPQQAASIILEYLIKPDDFMDISLEEKSIL